MFDPAGGTAPDIAGQDLANPSAALLAMANMLRHLGEVDSSRALRASILGAIAEGASTRDVGGDLSCSAFTAEVAERLGERSPRLEAALPGRSRQGNPGGSGPTRSSVGGSVR